jgi:hypothetical protein
MAGKAGATRGITASVIKYFLENPGAHVLVEGLAKQFGVSESQAAGAVSYIIREGKLPGVRAVQNGNIWIYDQQSGKAPKWEVVRKTANGSQAVLEDEEGNLWVAKPAGI